jgi:hypothetical protein
VETHLVVLHQRESVQVKQTKKSLNLGKLLQGFLLLLALLKNRDLFQEGLRLKALYNTMMIHMQYLLLVLSLLNKNQKFKVISLLPIKIFYRMKELKGNRTK